VKGENIEGDGGGEGLRKNYTREENYTLDLKG
jgi:hypothetical protein